MSKIRMNTEFRNKILNRYIDHAEQKATQEKEAFLQAREDVDKAYLVAFPVAQQVVSRSYPQEDVDTCKSLKKKYGSPLDVVAKDKCFYFSYAKDELNEDEDERDREVSEHFDFGLYGALGDSSYGSENEAKKFAYAYYRDELKAKNLNPDILAQQEGKDDNPHKTKHVDLNDKALGYSGYSSYNSDNDNAIGLTKQFDSQYYLDIIGTSHCRSRTIACTKDEFSIFKMLKLAKANVITCHQKWIDSIEKRKGEMKMGLKAYRYLSEGIELMQKLGISIDEAELVRCNSTGLTIYNPENLAQRLLSMENTNKTREQKIADRILYEKKDQAVN
jgi:hypothetical protein